MLATAIVGVFVLSEVLGRGDETIEVLGVRPGSEHTFLTHAVMHVSWWHLIDNFLGLEIIGPFIEKWLGKLWYFVSFIFITATGALLAAELAPESWNGGNNPVGISIFTRALIAAGIYLGTQRLISNYRDRIVQLARNAKREAASWIAAAVATAISLLILWVMFDLEGGAEGVAHTAGAALGITIAVGNAIKRSFRKHGQAPHGNETAEE